MVGVVTAAPGDMVAEGTKIKKADARARSAAARSPTPFNPPPPPPPCAPPGTPHTHPPHTHPPPPPSPLTQVTHACITCLSSTYASTLASAAAAGAGGGGGGGCVDQAAAGVAALTAAACPASGGVLCGHCLAIHPPSHRTLQVRRNVYRDVVRVADVAGDVDCAGVQTYTTNGAKV